jgi:hypothetical protein
MICTLIERSVPPALAGAAQLRGFGNFSCWYVVLVHVLVLKTPSSLKSRMAAGSQPMPHTFNFLVNSNIKIEKFFFVFFNCKLILITLRRYQTKFREQFGMFVNNFHFYLYTVNHRVHILL